MSWFNQECPMTATLFSVLHAATPGAFQRWSVVPTWYCWLAQIVFYFIILPWFLGFCYGWLSCIVKLLCCSSVSNVFIVYIANLCCGFRVCTGCFILKMDPMLCCLFVDALAIPISNFLPGSVYSVLLDLLLSATNKNRLGKYWLLEHALTCLGEPWVLSITAMDRHVWWSRASGSQHKVKSISSAAVTEQSWIKHVKKLKSLNL